MFITLEGIDGSGKSTQARALAQALQAQGRHVVLTREPGGTEIGDAIRHLLLDHPGGQAMSVRAELLLFCASRAQLVDELIRPSLQRGGVVLCDRYTDSSLAYQGYGRGVDLEQLRRLLDFATDGLTPDLTLYYDLDPQLGLERRRRARLLTADDWNRLDAQELAFHQRVHAGYEALIAQQPARWARLDASQPVEAVLAASLAIIQERLGQH
ncbi:MAG: dTMP kinase [Anaerolineae bacterium]|nr:dTMP kinase [Anaerolineae bacterium]